MSHRQAITEESGVHKEWYEEAQTQTLDTLRAFLQRLTENYGHDYGTICHAVAAAAIGAATAVNKSPVGGISGFQASCVMWEFVQNWMHLGEQALQLLKFDDMLYPQMQYKFEKTITTEIWEDLQKKAAANIENNKGNEVHPNVLKHWESIVAGNIPFDYSINDQHP